MTAIEKLKNIKTYDDFYLFAWDDVNLVFKYSRFEHPIFFLGKALSDVIYKNIKDIHDFNEFNIEYKKHYENMGVDVSPDEYRDIADLYLLKYDIDDIYRYTIKTTLSYLIHYNNHVVRVYIIINDTTSFDIIKNDIVIKNDNDIIISELVIDMRMKKLEYIKNL